MTPPSMAGWNLAVRFGLELAAVAALAILGWRVTSSPARWILVAAFPIAAMALWVVFNVPDDPSRSGAAPVVVPGVVRLVLELGILLGGAAALAMATHRAAGLAVLALILVHYAASMPRVEWLMQSA